MANLCDLTLASTFNLNGLGAAPVIKRNAGAIAAGSAGFIALM